MKLYFRLLSFARPFGWYAGAYFGLALLSTVFGLLNFTLIIPLLDVLFGTVSARAAVPPEFSLDADFVRAYFNYQLLRIIAAEGKLGALQFVSVAIVASVLIANVFRYLAQRVIESARQSLVYNLRQTVFERALNLDLSYFTNERRGNLVSRLTTDVQEVENGVVNTFKAAFREPFAIVAYFVALFLISYRLTLFTLLVVPLSGLAIGTIVRRLKKDARRSQEALGELISIMDEAFGGLRIVRAFGAGGYVREKFERENGRYARHLRAMGNKRELSSPISEILGVGVVAVILLYGGSLVLNEEGNLSASAFIGYIAIFSQVMRPAKSLTQALSTIQRALVAGERALEVVDARPRVAERPDARVLPPFREHVTFENVTFAYDQDPVLHGVSFELPKGRTVALVGPSGGGKSTIADLLPRFYDPQDGAIRIDGQDIRALTLDSLRAQLGIVTQESILFNDTIFNNIAFGVPDADPAAVERAARIAHAHDFIRETPDGYQTVVGERGARLSGGQRQRISIARAVLKNPPILILDEATSALDTESEKIVQEALANLMQHRTTLVIAHRLSTIQRADEILVVEAGRIVERGTHTELSERPGGVYRRLHALQQA